MNLATKSSILPIIYKASMVVGEPTEVALRSYQIQRNVTRAVCSPSTIEVPNANINTY